MWRGDGECEEVNTMYKRSKTDNRFFLDITKPGKTSPAIMPKSVEKKSSSKPSFAQNRMSITKVANSDENKKWKKTDEWKPLW